MPETARGAIRIRGIRRVQEETPMRHALVLATALTHLTFAAAFGAGHMAPPAPAAAPAMTAFKATAAERLTFQPAPNFMAPGAQFVLLAGDPAKDGPYVVRVKMPSGYTLAPHWHSRAEHITVISGKFFIGTGDRVDKTKADGLGPGGFFAIPARTQHFAWAEGETVVDVHALGPADIDYVDAKDDPRKSR
jgi:quercetin dioxygenase-like cupin family protein